MSLLQGLSLGVPAIVTDVGGMAEVVRLAKAGFTVSPVEPNDMTAAILKMAGDEAERRDFSEAGGAAFRSLFSLDAMADAYLELYRKTPSA